MAWSSRSFFPLPPQAFSLSVDCHPLGVESSAPAGTRPFSFFTRRPFSVDGVSLCGKKRKKIGETEEEEGGKEEEEEEEK